MTLSSGTEAVVMDPNSKPEFEGFALTRQEYITAIAHFYRGEVARSNIWRVRVDATTNWAVGAAAAVAGFTFSNPETPHLVLFFGDLVVFALLWIESRRFRIYDVFRARVRRTEENFFGPILTRTLNSPIEDWGTFMARDFLHPRFKMNFWEAMGLRLRRNYLVLFALLFLCWIAKVAYMGPEQGTFLEKLRVDGMPAEISLVLVGGFHLLILILFVTTAHRKHEDHEEWGIGKEVEIYDA